MEDDVTKCSTRELLVEVIGEQSTKALYTGGLRPLLSMEETWPRYTSVRLKRARRRLTAARELVKRCFEEQLPNRDVMSSPQLVREYLQVHCAFLGHEVFACMFLDSCNHVIAFEVMFRGTIDAAAVYPREVVKTTLRHNASGVIFAHNHPSGNAEPSQADRVLTRRLTDALALVEVRVLDHIVVGVEGTVSFAERGWL